ncbi:hypothetical protein DMP17_34130 [Pseudonocardia sp. TMWB2A]|uniref:DUF262 domain-containing protein n=1 Tax=Pseudonocardia sp. TMWB2A TaxID=687430 RepID=UPI00307E6ED0
MTEQGFLQYQATGIAGLLRTQLLAVPFYQRSYSWNISDSKPPTREVVDDTDKSQVDEYWEDLNAGFQSQRSYFLGTVVLANDGDSPGRKLVIDGQQRLATTSLMVAAIRDELERRGASDYANSTQNEFIGTFDRQVGSLQPRLILNSDDRDYYNRAILDRDLSAQPANHSQELLSRAHRKLSEYVAEFARDAGEDWKTRLNDLLTYLDRDVQIVAIDVATQADAFLIFETLNDRGADLTVADLLKNYLFSQAESRLDEVRDSWVKTLTNLDLDKVGNQRFTSFARHLMSSKYGRTRERELYARIRNAVSGPAATVRFSQELRDSSRVYYALLTVDSDYWSDFGEPTRAAAQVLIDLNLEQYRPLLLAALTTFDSAEVGRFMSSMVSWTVRGMAGGLLGAGSAESAFGEAAREIRAGRVTTTEGILEIRRVSDLIPSDATFESAFASWRVTRGAVARYLLRAIETEERGEKEPELVVNSNVEHVNLEHILPQSARIADWSQFPSEELKLWAHRLGNMCLLQKGPNGRIGNKSWNVKAPVLSASKFLTTSRLGATPTWNAQAIAENQQRLAATALRVWPREPRK